MIGEALDHRLVLLGRLLHVRRPERLQALREPELRPRIGRRQTRRLAEERQRLGRPAGAHQHRRQVALGEGVLGFELDRVAKRVGRLIGAPGARERYPERDERVRVRGVEFERPLQRGDRLCRSPQFGQTQPVAVGELGVVEHAVERLEHRQRIFQEAVLQQPQHVGLGLDPTLGDRDHAHERVIDHHHGLPAARRVVERVAPDHRLLELGRAARRQARRVEVVERDLEDFGGLAGGHDDSIRRREEFRGGLSHRRAKPSGPTGLLQSLPSIYRVTASGIGELVDLACHLGCHRLSTGSPTSLSPATGDKQAIKKSVPGAWRGQGAGF